MRLIILLIALLASIYCTDGKECQERTGTQKCYQIRDRETCLIANDPRGSYAGPCGWCGDKCGNENVCEPVVWLKRNRVTDYEDCLKEEKATTMITTTAAGAFYVVKGDSDDDNNYCYESSGCDTAAANVDETHAVRCCSDVEIGGWRKKDTCNVWTESNSWGACKELTWSEANAFCIAQSARLCTRTELEASCSEDTGCNFDHRLIWSKTPASDVELVDNDELADKMCKGSCSDLKRNCGTLLGCGGEKFDVSKHCPKTCKKEMPTTNVAPTTMAKPETTKKAVPTTTPVPAEPAEPDTRKKCDDLEGWCVKMDKTKDCCSETIQTKCPGLCDTCPAVHCEWNDWVVGSCSAECGTGTRTNTRVKLVEEKNGGTCTGQSTEVLQCQDKECPIHCEWNNWIIGDCSETCGGGSRTNTRTQKVSAEHGGDECNGPTSVDESCNVQECPVDCQWAAWQIGDCSETCGDGVRENHRVKLTEALFGGAPCEGKAKATESCNNGICPEQCCTESGVPDNCLGLCVEEQDDDPERRSTFLSVCDKFQDIVQRCTIGPKEPTMLTTAPPKPATDGCPFHYAEKEGDLPGWGTDIGSALDLTREECAMKCNREKACLSFEHSPTQMKCNLNKIAEPSQRPYKDFVFCTKMAASEWGGHYLG